MHRKYYQCLQCYHIHFLYFAVVFYQCHSLYQLVVCGLHRLAEALLLNRNFYILSPICHLYGQHAHRARRKQTLLSRFPLIIIMAFGDVSYYWFYHPVLDLVEPFVDVPSCECCVYLGRELHKLSLLGIHPRDEFVVFELKSCNALETFFQVWLNLCRVFSLW